MKFKICLILSVLFIFSISSFGQTAEDFENKYGAEKYYKVRPYALMKPTFDKEGRFCRALIEPNYFAESTDEIPFPGDKYTIYLETDEYGRNPIRILDSAELKEIFDEFAPPNSRKGNGKATVRSLYRGLAGIILGFEYENIEINAALVRTGHQGADASGIKDTAVFFNPRFGSFESAVIVWKDRTCVE